MAQRTIKRVAIYCRVSTDDQTTDRQERDLTAYAHNSGYVVVGTFQEVASGTRNDRKERAKVIDLAKKRAIDAVLVTETTRWGRSMVDLVSTVQELEGRGVSLISLSGISFDFTTAQGKLVSTILAALAEFERDLIIERTKSGIEAARARGAKIGRQMGQNVTVDKYRTKVLKLLAEGETIRSTASKLGISPTTVQKIKRAAN